MAPTSDPFDPQAAAQLRRVRTVTESLDQFLGLYLIPPGLAVVLIGLANALPSGPVNTWLVLAAPIVGVSVWLAVRAHYLRVVGHVKRPLSRSELANAALGAGLFLVGAALDTVLDTPISLTLVAAAAAVAIGAIPSGRQRRALTVGCLVGAVAAGPGWWGDASGALATIVLGVLFIGAGLASHATLDEALTPVGATPS